MGLFSRNKQSASSGDTNAARYEILDALGYIIPFSNPAPEALEANPALKTLVEDQGFVLWLNLLALQLFTAGGHLYGNPKATRAAEIMTESEFRQHCFKPSSLPLMKTDMRKHVSTAMSKAKSLGYLEAAESLNRAIELIDNMSFTDDSFDPGF